MAPGKKLLRRNRCLGCHSLDGSPMSGPTFKGLFGRKTVVIRDGPPIEIVADEAYIRNSIRDPLYDLVKGFDPAMPADLNLTDAEIETIVEFIKTLK